MRSDNVGFAVVTTGYLAVTTGEALLAPLYPQLGPDLGLGGGAAGLVFGVLAASIAVGSLAGGFLLARRGARPALVLGLVLVAAGCVGSALADSAAAFVPAQVVIGLGSGLFFASGLRSAAVLAGERRRGLALAIFGVAFSGGLAVAGGLAALGTLWGWRSSFLATAGLAVATAAGAAAFARVPAPPPSRQAGRPRLGLRASLSLPLRVGGVTAASQYGTVAFLPLFAVQAWGLSPATAALVLTIARVASVPAKLVSGNASDGVGAIRVARRVGLVLALLGAWWTLVPGAPAAAWAAVAFAALVGALAPLANVLALDSFEERSELLGAFRSAQIGIGAAASAAIGAGVAWIGLRPSLLVAAAFVPATLLSLARQPQPAESAPSIPS